MDLGRPSLVAYSGNKNDNDDDQTTEKRERHEITYNWYEPGAKLGRHLDEHHEETKGPMGGRLWCGVD